MMVKPEMILGLSQEISFAVIPLKHIDVTRTADTTIDVMWKKHIEDYWNVDGEKNCRMHGQVSQYSLH